MLSLSATPLRNQMPPVSVCVDSGARRRVKGHIHDTPRVSRDTAGEQDGGVAAVTSLTPSGVGLLITSHTDLAPCSQGGISGSRWEGHL